MMAIDCNRLPGISPRVVVRTIAVIVVTFSITTGLVSHELGPPGNSSQTRDRSGGAPEGIGERIARALNNLTVEGPLGGIVRQAFRPVPESTIQFNNLDGSPVIITGASARFLDIREGSTVVGYVVRPNLTLLNNTDRRLTAVVLRYKNDDGSVVFSYVERLSSLVEPLASFTLNNRTAPSDGDPSSVVATVTGVIFDDGGSWGDMPPTRN